MTAYCILVSDPWSYVSKRLYVVVTDELCAQEVITTELIDGLPLDKLFDAPYEIRVDIASKIMRLCLREMFVLRCMQTDPNWANFFYNTTTKQVFFFHYCCYNCKVFDDVVTVITKFILWDKDVSKSENILRKGILSLQLKFV